jgi:CreA protein
MQISAARARNAMRWLAGLAALGFALVCAPAGFIRPALADDPDLIFKKTTVWKFLSPDHKIGTYGIDDPEVEGVACHFSVPEKGGWTGWLGLAEELSQASLSCRQYGPIKFKRTLEQGEEMFSQRRSIFFKRMQIVRGCDAKRNMLVYLVYTDKLIEGSPENSTSTVPIMPWGSDPPVKCSEFIK